MAIPLVATGTATAGDVKYKRLDLINMLPQYDTIRDCIEGSEAVKAAGIKYLPMPNPSDVSPDNIARYNSYRSRAVFYNVTGRTLNGLVGQVFAVDPEIIVPPVLNPVIKDANGSGVTLKQQANETHALVTAYGRAGLFIDFPRVEGPVTRAQQDSGEVRPNIVNYAPWNIINWRTTKRGSRHYLSLVVLEEKYDHEVNEFEVEQRTQWRVLSLDSTGKYRQRLYRDETSGVVLALDIYPQDARGQQLDYIPFTFVGAINNDVSIDPAPLFDLADLNIAHYRNSADYEDSLFMVGQPTPVATGLTKDWVNDVLKGRIEIGSRAVIPLPDGANFTIVQANPNTMASEGMEKKERQMVALGAKLVEQRTVQRTATEASQEEANETSTLAMITDNVSAAYKFALECCLLFAGGITVADDAKTDVITFKLNTDFALASMSPDEVRNVIEAWQKNAITFSEMRGKLRRSGLAVLDDKSAKKELKEDANDELNGSFTNIDNDELGGDNDDDN